MQIVIDIPDRYMTTGPKIANGSFASKMILNAVYDGVVLPKGHGRLISDTELKKQFADKEGDTFTAWHFYETIDKAPTIIEADTKSEDN